MVDLTPIIEPLIQLLGAALLTSGTFVVWRIQQWVKTRTGFELDDEARANINTALENGIAWATNQINDLAEEHSEIEIKNEMIRLTAEYALSRVPDSLNHFGVDEAGIEQLVRGRLERIWPDANIQ